MAIIKVERERVSRVGTMAQAEVAARFAALTAAAGSPGANTVSLVGNVLTISPGAQGPAGPNMLLKPPIGTAIVPALIGGTGTVTSAADRLDLVPIAISQKWDVTVSEIGIIVTTALAASNLRLLIYDADVTTGSPTTLLLDSGNLSGATAAYVSAPLTPHLVLPSGKVVWLGLWTSGAIGVRAVTSARSLGAQSGSTTNTAGVLRRTVTFGSTLPSPWGLVASDLANQGNAPDIRLIVSA